MQQNRKKIYEDKFKEILSKSDYPKDTVIKYTLKSFLRHLNYVFVFI